MAALRETTAAVLSLSLSGCLSASEGSRGDGGPGDGDGVDDLLRSAQSLAPEIDWVRTIRADLDGDLDAETVFVGVDDLIGCLDRQGPAFVACSFP